MEKAGRDRMGMNRRRLLGAGLAALAGAALGAGAAPAQDADAAAFIQRFAAEAIQMLGNRGLDRAERVRRFEALVREGFDLDTISQLALGQHWRTAREDQRRRFTELFERVLLASYARRLDEYTNQTLRVGTTSPAGRDTMVQSWIENGGQPVRVDWRVRESNGGFKILDVVVEGVSLLVTHRNELATVIERAGGVDGLIAHLEQRLEQEAAAGAG